MQNALNPDRMTATERLDEAALILGRGIGRLRLKEEAGNGEKSLDFTAPQRVHGLEQTQVLERP
jgi:hypothetical protein